MFTRHFRRKFFICIILSNWKSVVGLEIVQFVRTTMNHTYYSVLIRRFLFSYFPALQTIFSRLCVLNALILHHWSDGAILLTSMLLTKFAVKNWKKVLQICEYFKMNLKSKSIFVGD